MTTLHVKISDFQKVNYHSVIDGPVTSGPHEILEIYKSLSGHWVARITDKSGYVSLDALSNYREGEE